ncbi:MAG TPA: hypothetical protein VK862_02525 [Afifellaceae bacterium]|nr:hypothetical protein [Afifellaceae bacterium]
MTVIPFPKLHASRKDDLPLAVFAHTLPEMAEADSVFDQEWLTNCIVNTTIGLFAARRLGLPIAHLILTPEDRPDEIPSPTLPGLKARPTEAVFSYSYPSIFSNALFSRYLDQYGHSKLALFGFAANDVGLVSAIEGSQRNLDIIFIRDCSPLFSIDECPLEMSDAAIFGTIDYFASVMTVPDFVEAVAGADAVTTTVMPPAEALIEPETLQHFISHSAGQAERLGLSQCADRLREARVLATSEANRETLAGEH